MLSLATQKVFESGEYSLMASSPQRVRCREIGPIDFDATVALLQTGFPKRRRDHWLRALKRLSEHATPAGFPRYGYLLEADEVPVGVILVVFSAMIVGGETRIRANHASWYVKPAFRAYAAMLASHQAAHRKATYLNITPARHTWPILNAQGYAPFCTGHFKAFPALSFRSLAANVRPVTPKISIADDLSSSEKDLLLAHASYGCISVTCSAAGRTYPFVFARCWHQWKPFGLPFSIPLPYALLVYCRALDDFIQFAGPLGRFLARRGLPMVFIESAGSISGLVGKFSASGPKFFRGPNRPHIGDLSYTESVIFGQ
jgi:hypothetical protein